MTPQKIELVPDVTPSRVWLHVVYRNEIVFSMLLKHDQLYKLRQDINREIGFFQHENPEPIRDLLEQFFAETDCEDCS